MKIDIYSKKRIMLYGDVLIIIASYYLTPLVYYKALPDLSAFLGLSEFVSIFVYLLVLYVFDFYSLEERMSSVQQTLKLFLSVFIANIINTSFFYFLHLRPYNASVLFVSSAIAMAMFYIWRLVLVDFNGVAVKPANVIILGAGNTGKMIYQLLKTHSNYFVAGFIDDVRTQNELSSENLTLLGGSRDLVQCVEKHNINSIVVCADGDMNEDVYPQLVKAAFSGVNVYEMPTFYEKIATKIPLMHVDHVWFSYANIHGVKKNVYNEKIKKIVDKTMACIGALIAMPLMILVAVLIKLDSKGPVIYQQRRVGFNENIFTLNKFRSMYDHAESQGAVWANKNDPRVTRIGKVIRLLRIDELPQLWNVLKGEMSFIGPRPERPEFVRQLEDAMPYYMLRHTIKPGITGWAQVNYDYGASVEDAFEKLQFDLFYIKNMTLLLDLYIMLRTVRVVIFGKGAR